MRWVPHLRINTRVRVLGRLGSTGAFTRRTEQHARGPVKNRRPLFTVENADKKNLQGYVGGLHNTQRHTQYLQKR